ncbi:MAG: enoyl-CoA hydratase/isomerase family protein [Myxococcaceae bacterium]|nr:enoyl-CoA hydratase/isomerase family protein [Myxococcaceae bacterium]
MEEEHVHYEVSGPAARLVIDRPKARNALSARAIEKLLEGIARAEADPAVRVIVLTGSGGTIFCAGGDLTSMAGGDGFLAGHERRRAYGLLMRRIQDATLPTIARVNGHALAGGLGLVLACDVAIAASSAELGLPEIDVGLFPMQVIALLQRHVGRKRALELVMAGDRLSAQQALEWGLLNRVVPPAELDGAVAAMVEKLAGKSRAVLELGRRAFYTAEDLPLGPAVEHLATQLSLNVLLEDAGEGVSAFLDKRRPRWKDK